MGQWKEALDKKKIVEAVLMDLSIAFDCFPHDLLIAKLDPYGFSEDSLVFFYSYLKLRKQNVKINNTYSAFDMLLPGVPQGSILGPILFNTFINDTFISIKISDLHNFGDDNTISSFANNIEEFLKTFRKKSSEGATDWFRSYSMIVNLGKFQHIV